jgi:hypothetical protein
LEAVREAREGAAEREVMPWFEGMEERKGKV